MVAWFAGDGVSAACVDCHFGDDVSRRASKVCFVSSNGWYVDCSVPCVLNAQKIVVVYRALVSAEVLDSERCLREYQSLIEVIDKTVSFIFPSGTCGADVLNCMVENHCLNFSPCGGWWAWGEHVGCAAPVLVLQVKSAIWFEGGRPVDIRWSGVVARTVPVILGSLVRAWYGGERMCCRLFGAKPTVVRRSVVVLRLEFVSGQVSI